MSDRFRQKGIALIAVLWVLAFLATIASTVAHQSRTSLLVTKNKIEQLKLRQAAESAILVSVATKVNSPSALITGQILNSEDNIQTTIAVQDESGKVDLNTAPVEVLQSLVMEIGLDENRALSVANTILDWRDEDNIVREGGAEDISYSKAGYVYDSKDANFERTEELQLLYNMPQDLYLAISPYVTVHTYDYGVNVSVADNLVRRAIENAAGLLLKNDELEEIDQEDLDEFTSLTEGYIYTFKAVAQNSSGMQQALSAIVRIERGNLYEPFTVLSWQ